MRAQPPLTYVHGQVPGYADTVGAFQNKTMEFCCISSFNKDIVSVVLTVSQVMDTTVGEATLHAHTLEGDGQVQCQECDRASATEERKTG